MKLVATLLFLFVLYGSFAQSKANYGYMNAVLHLKTGDSLSCLVEKQIEYGQALLYKRSDYDKAEEIPVSDVDYFQGDGKIFRSVPLYSGFVIMELLDTGKISLLFFNEIKYGERKYDNKTGLRTKKGDILIHYVVNRPGLIQELKDSTFRIILKQVFSDCQRMAGKVSRGEYYFEDMPEIVREYNACKNENCSHSSPQ